MPDYAAIAQQDIQERLTELTKEKDKVIKLIKSGWSNKSIALYLRTDVPTIKRFKKEFQM